MAHTITASAQDSSTLKIQLVAFAGFIVLGLIAGAFGVAFTSMKQDFALDDAAAGLALIANTVGYTGLSFVSGAITRRLGYGMLFLAGIGLIGLGMVVYAVMPSYLVVIVAALLAGAGAGVFDAAMNAYFAAHHNARSMNWLHACFGIGTTISPLIMTFAITNGSWRTGYLIMAGMVAVVFVIYFLLRNAWQPLVITEKSVSEVKPKSSAVLALRSPLVWLSMLLFFVYAGLEASPGVWANGLFAEVRGVPEATAGLLVSLYWGSFTVGRLFFGAIITRWKDTIPLVRGCIIGALIGALLWWWNPNELVGYFGLVLLGFAQAPLFPVLISNTPRYVGKALANDAIGFQIAGASLGVALIPSLIGVLASLDTLEVVAPTIAVCAVIIFVLHEILSHGEKRQANGKS